MLFVLYDGVRIFFESLMRLEGVPGTEVLALPLGYSIAVILNLLLLLFLSQKHLMFSVRSIVPHFLRSLAAAFVAGVTAYATLNFFVFGLRTETVIGIFVHGLLAGIAGIIGAAFTYYVLRSPELHEVYRSFHKRIFKANVAPPQDEDHLSV
jgi:peptidoglycan biosynthesis protein MviN/MurJ (putative lipid II flippase)